MSEETISEILARARRSQDPDIRTKEIEFRAWQEAGINLQKAQEALAAELSRFGGIRADLEIEIAAQIAGGKPVIAREREAIAKSEALIAECEGRVDSARAALDKAMAEHTTVIDGLRSNVAVAAEVVERVELR